MSLLPTTDGYKAPQKQLQPMVESINKTVDGFIKDKNFYNTFTVVQIIDDVKKAIAKDPSILSPYCKTTLNATTINYVLEDMKYNVIYNFVNDLRVKLGKDKFDIFSEFDIPTMVNAYYADADKSPIFNAEEYFTMARNNRYDDFIISEAAHLLFRTYTNLLRSRKFGPRMADNEYHILSIIEDTVKKSTLSTINKTGYILNSVKI